MEDIYETLLYIAYNLENQNQIITINAIRQPLGWMQSRGFILEKEIEWLITNGFLIRNDENEFTLTDKGRIESSRNK